MKIVKYIILAVLAIAGVCIGAVSFLQRDISAWHPAVAGADLPAVIPVRDFYADRRATWGHAVSASGRFVAYAGTKLTEQYVFIRDIDQDREITSIKKDGDFFWDPHMDDLRMMVDGRMWRIDPHNPDREAWIDVTPRGFQSGYHIPSWSASPDLPQVVYSFGRLPNVFDLYTVDADGQNKQILVENEGRTINWMLNARNEPVLRFDRPEEDDTIHRALTRPNDGTDWAPLMDISINDTFFVLEVSQDAKFAFALSSRNRDKAALVRLDLTDGSEQVIYEDPKADIYTAVNLSIDDDTIDGIIVKYRPGGFVPISEKGQLIKTLLDQMSSSYVVDNLNGTSDGRFVFGHLSDHALGYQAFRIDVEEGTITNIGDWDFSDRYADSLSAPEYVEFQTRDGLGLSAILTRAKGVDAAGPAIVYIHGGPASLAQYEYDHWFQFLANRGYSVLSVNFRGSEGYGKAFQAAGFRAFGRAMQDDIVDAAQWLVDQGVADPDAIGVMGASYGGYASALAMTRDAGVFAAAVPEVAMLDVVSQTQFPPYSWGLSLAYWTRYFGDPEVPQDLEDMKTYSPINQVANLSDPVLMIAGRQDQVVGVEQTERFVQAAQDAGKDIETLYFDDEGHGNYRWTNNVIRARRVEDFLAKHLGGRSGGWDMIETALPYLK